MRRQEIGQRDHDGQKRKRDPEVAEDESGHGQSGAALSGIFAQDAAGAVPVGHRQEGGRAEAEKNSQDKACDGVAVGPSWWYASRCARRKDLRRRGGGVAASLAADSSVGIGRSALRTEEWHGECRHESMQLGLNAKEKSGGTANADPSLLA